MFYSVNLTKILLKRLIRYLMSNKQLCFLSFIIWLIYSDSACLIRIKLILFSFFRRSPDINWAPYFSWVLLFIDLKLLSMEQHRITFCLVFGLKDKLASRVFDLVPLSVWDPIVLYWVSLSLILLANSFYCFWSNY